MMKAIIESLRSLDLSDGGSHSRLSAIASCFFQPTFGWTRGACEELRNVLIETLEDANGNDDNDHAHAYGCDYGHHRCDQHQVSYDELDNERHKAVCELRKVCTKLDESVWTWIEDVAIAIGAQDNQSDEYESMLPKITDRLIHLLGGDQPTLSDLYGIWQDGEESESRGSESVSEMTKNAETINLGDKSDGELMENGENHKMASITDELRKMDNGHSRTCPKSDEEMSENAPSVSITDELRKFKGHINTRTTPEMVLALRAEINCIADRIDEQLDRICEQQEKVLQQTIDEMTEFREHDAEYALGERDYWHQQATDTMNRADAMEHERDELQSAIDEMTDELDSARAKNRRLTWHIDQMQGGSKKWREQCEVLKAERDELQAKLDDYDKTRVALPKDEDGEVIHVGDELDGYAKTIEVVELRYGRSGWVLISRDGNGYTDTFAFAHHHEPTVEQVIRDLTFGKITEAQAIERIEGIHGQG